MVFCLLSLLLVSVSFALRSEYVFSTSTKPKYSIILTVHNSEMVISSVVDSILRYTCDTYELLVYFDFCEDSSTEIVRSTISSGRTPNLLRVVYFESSIDPVFETNATVTAFNQAQAPYVVLYQDDQIMQVSCWNEALALPIMTWNDVLSVSARCAHSLTIDTDVVGRCGSNIFVPLPIHVVKPLFHVRQTSNRGPLMIDRSKALEIGFLDAENYVMENDDHEFHLRAWIRKRWITGLVTVPFKSPRAYALVRKEHPQHAYEMRLLAKLREVKTGSLEEGWMRHLNQNHSYPRPLPRVYSSIRWLFDSDLIIATLFTTESSGFFDRWHASIRSVLPYARILALSQGPNLKASSEDPLLHVRALKDEPRACTRTHLEPTICKVMVIKQAVPFFNQILWLEPGYDVSGISGSSSLSSLGLDGFDPDTEPGLGPCHLATLKTQLPDRPALFFNMSMPRTRALVSQWIGCVK